LSEPNRSGRVGVGRVIGVFGLRGDVKVAASALALVAGLPIVAIDASGARRELRVSLVRPAHGHLRVRFEGIEDATAAQLLRGATLQAQIADLPALPDDAYRESELIGMQVHDASMGAMGDVVGVAHYPGSDMLIVGPKRTLVPLLKAYGVVIDRASETINITLPPGFEEIL
jgi:16S rRNA processing protein RimM